MFSKRMKIPTDTAFMEFLREFGAAENQRQLKERIEATGRNSVAFRAAETVLTLTLQPDKNVTLDKGFMSRLSRNHENPVTDAVFRAMARLLREFKLQESVAG